MTKFSVENTSNIINLYEHGMPLRWAAYSTGINYTTVWRWMKKGEKAKRGKYHQFYLDMRKARATYILYHLEALNKSGKDETHEYLLKVTDPEHFNLSNKLEHSGEVTNVNKNVKIDEDLLDEIISETKINLEDKDDTEEGAGS